MSSCKLITVSGFSGTLKSTFIKNYLEKDNSVFIPSPSKYMINVTKDATKGNEIIPPAIWQVEARQFALKTLIDNAKSDTNIILERSVFDYAFWAKLQNHLHKDADWDMFNKFEENLCDEFEHIVLVNNAEEFTKDFVIKNLDPTRALVYKDFKQYFERQFEYLEFMNDNAKFTKIIKFDDEDAVRIMSGDKDFFNLFCK